MAGSAPLGDGRPVLGADGDGSRQTGPPSRLAGPPPPRGISGDGRPPRPAASTSTAKKRRSTFVAPTRPTGPRPGGVLPRMNLDAGIGPSGVQQAASAPGDVWPRQLLEAPPPGPRLPAPLRHEAPLRGSVFTGTGSKAQMPSFSEPAQLPSRQVQKPSMEVAATVSDTRRTTWTPSLQAADDYYISSPMPFCDDWSSTPTANNTFQDPVGTSPSFVGMLTQEQEPADLEVLTQAILPDSGSSRGRGGNYNHSEDIQLCWSWMAITFDPRTGTDQSRGTYWNRIAEHYHENKTFVSDRNANSLEKRWNGIQKECIRFQECIEKIERLRPSGVPHTEYINLAQKSYDETKGFPLLHCWMEVHHTEKFQSIYDATKKAQGKRPAKSSADTTPSQEAQQNEPPPSKRPPGRKQSKQKPKSEGEDEYAKQLATFLKMKAEEHRKREERWKAEKELEERRFSWEQEQKIMFCDTSNMDDSQRAYIAAMRKHIARSKEASVGGATSEQGSGGDAEGADVSSANSDFRM